MSEDRPAGETMNRPELERQLRWLMILRVVTVTTLLISAFGIELLVRPGQTLRPLFFLSATTYGMVLLYAALDRWLSGTRSFIYIQLVGDALVVTAFVSITGGLDSPMSFLYLLPISVASMLLYRSGGLALAGVSWTLYTGLVVFGSRWFHLGVGFADSVERVPGRVLYHLVVHLVGFVAFAILASYLSGRLHDQGKELMERRGAVVRLQALNENIIESIHSGLVTTDLDGRINFINRGGCEITGHSQAMVEGRSLENVFGLDAGFLREARRLLLAKRRFRFEKHFATSDGRRIFLGIAMSNLQDRMGSPLGYILIFQDLTEIHAMEQEVRLKERMSALGEMAAGMAHELRNPLAAISGAVQYLKGDLRPEGETLELMDIILRESHRLDQAIRDFLTFARPGKFSPQRCDLVRLVEDNLKLLSKSREFGREHRLQTRYASPEIWCDIDPNRVKQVFWNLATNALKAMPGGGTFTIEVKLPHLGEDVEICFADEGRGMDDRAKQRYFQPFCGSFEEGTGLGAAIVYRLVEEHGGKIGIETAPGRGTRVRILLPRHRRLGAPASEIPALALAAGGGRR